MRPSEAVARGRQVLGSAAEARLLLAHVLGVSTTELLLADNLSLVQLQAYDSLVARRGTGIPVQHLTGTAPFRTIEVSVGPGVFIPRPETEVMTGWALEVLGAEPAVVVELCAGSGAISLAMVTEQPQHAYHAVELSEEAWPYLQRNLGETSVECALGDMAGAFSHLDGTVDLVIANPPYIPLESYAEVPAEVRDYDPSMALFSGDDGLDAMRTVAQVADRLLKPGGWVCAEHADVQGESAPEVFLRHGAFDRVTDRTDLNDRPRYVIARKAI